ncbi:MAG TPA: tetratricopeptide repeat protein [Polyangiaceae bacterium]|nr:tetratricopeptide repeat protein [Polyangiaceae bacterium]
MSAGSSRSWVGYASVLLCGAAVGCGGAQKSTASVAARPVNAAAVSQLAQGAEAAKQPEGRRRAMGLFESAVKTDRELFEAHFNLGVLKAEAGDLEQAERSLSEAERLAPNAEDVVVALAEVRRRRGEPQAALDSLRRFVKDNPNATLAPIVLMAVLRESGKADQAIDLAHQVLVRRARDPYALSELALAHLERAEVDTAEILAQEAAKADPKSAVAERTLGLVALKKGDDALSFRHFARATELDPTDTTARLNMGTVLLQAGVYDRAAEQFRAVLTANAEDTPATLGLAAALRGGAKKDDSRALQEAEKLLTALLVREPGNWAAQFNLALLYSGPLKRPDAASALFKRVLDSAPSQHPAHAEAEKYLAGTGKNAGP